MQSLVGGRGHDSVDRIRRMSRSVHLFEQPDRFIVGTVGMPGERQFFLQAKEGPRVVSVSLEKQQVALLAERLDALLDEVVRRSTDSVDIPSSMNPGPDDTDPLETPLAAEFTVGALGLGWNSETQMIVIEAHEYVEDPGEIPDLEEDSDDEDAPDLLRVRLTGAQARSFVRRTNAVVSAGRPPCPFCELPLDPSGHICPRANGYRR